MEECLTDTGDIDAATAVLWQPRVHSDSAFDPVCRLLFHGLTLCNYFRVLPVCLTTVKTLAQAILTLTVLIATSPSSLSSSSSCRAWLRNPSERALRSSSSSSSSLSSFLVAVVLRRWPSSTKVPRQVFPAHKTRAFCRGRRIEAPSSAFIVDDGAVRVLRKLHRRQRIRPRRRRRPPVFVVWSSSSLLAQVVGNSECTRLCGRTADVLPHRPARRRVKVV